MRRLMLVAVIAASLMPIAGARASSFEGRRFVSAYFAVSGSVVHVIGSVTDASSATTTAGPSSLCITEDSRTDCGPGRVTVQADLSAGEVVGEIRHADGVVDDVSLQVQAGGNWETQACPCGGTGLNTNSKAFLARDGVASGTFERTTDRAHYDGTDPTSGLVGVITNLALA